MLHNTTSCQRLCSVILITTISSMTFYFTFKTLYITKTLNTINMANKILELVDDDNDSTKREDLVDDNLLNPDCQDSYYFSDEDLDDWERSLEHEDFEKEIDNMSDELWNSPTGSPFDL